MTRSKRALSFFAFLAFLSFVAKPARAVDDTKMEPVSWRRSARQPTFNDIAVEVPFQGGGLLMYTRSRNFGRHVKAGVVVGGGVINRAFNLSVPGSPDLDARTKTLMLPFVGPRLTLMADFIGVSVAYGLYYARTDFDVDWPGTGHFSGKTNGWGTGFYAPLLVLDFYDSRHNVLIGVGLGGLLGSTGPKLKASGPAGTITSDESPIQTLTLHLSLLWADGGWMGGKKRDEDF